MAIDVSFDFDEPPLSLGEPIPPAIRLDTGWERPCKLCGAPMTGHYWSWAGNTYYGATCHQRCTDEAERRERGEKPFVAQIPQRFAQFDVRLFRDAGAIDDSLVFTPDSALKALALVGQVGVGKSRLMWHVIGQFFALWSEHRHQNRWVEDYLFSDLVTEYDQSRISAIKNAQFVFIDDIADLPPGRVRSAIQDVIRFRVKTQKWTFLTIDNIKFDPDLIEHIFIERGVTVMVQG